MDRSEVAADFVALGVSQLSDLSKQLCHMQLFGQPLFVNSDEAELSLASEPGTSCPITRTFLGIVHDALMALPNKDDPDVIMDLIKTKVEEYNETLKQQAEEALKNIPSYWFDEE